MQQRWAGYFGLISTLRANIYQSEIDFCWLNTDSYRYDKILILKSVPCAIIITVSQPPGHISSKLRIFTVPVFRVPE